MIKRRKFPKIFFGWWIVLASGVLTFWGQGVSQFGFSALFKPISSELGFTRAATSVAASFGKFEGGILSPPIGWICDKFGPRWVVISGVFIMALSLILMYFINSFWTFLLVWGVLLGIGANIGLMLPLDKTITNWFVRKRGRALTTKFMSTALAAVLTLPIVALLVSAQGWRMACVTAGIIMLVVGLPLGWFFIKQHRPEYYGLLPDGATTEEVTDINRMIDKGVQYAAEVQEIEFTLRQAMRTPAFWLLMLSNAGFNMVAPVFIVHGVPLLTDMGVDPVRAAVMIGIMSVSVIPGTFIGMFVADRMKKGQIRFLVVGALIIHIIGITVFLLNQTPAMVYFPFVAHHFAGGVNGSLNSVIVSRYFGRKAFGSIRGTIMMFILPFAVAAPIYAGWVYDTTGSYVIVLFVSAIILGLCTVFMSSAFSPKPPAQITGINNIL